MGIFKTRSAFINKILSQTPDADLKRWLSNGFIPDSLQDEYQDFISQNANQETDTDLDKISDANWFAIYPNKVAGTITPGTGFLNPVIVKGTLKDAVDTINNTLNNVAVQDATNYMQDIPVELKETLSTSGLELSTIIEKLEAAQKEITIEKAIEPLPASVQKLFAYLKLKPGTSAAGMDVKFDNRQVKDYFHYGFRAIKGKQYGDNDLDFKAMFIKKFGEDALNNITRIVDRNGFVLNNGVFVNISTNQFSGAITRITLHLPQVFSGIKANAEFYINAINKPESERNSGEVLAINEINKYLNISDQTPTEQTNMAKNKNQPKFKVGDFVKYIAGDLNKETWHGVVRSVVDLDTEYAYRINAYYDGMNATEQTNEKYEVSLSKSRSKDYRDAQAEYNNRKTKNAKAKDDYTVVEGEPVIMPESGIVTNVNAGPEIDLPRQDLAIIVKNKLLDNPIDGPKTQTVEQTIKKYNPGLSIEEIKAWVYYKRRFGNPMRGWEAYFLSGGGGFSTLLQTTKDTIIKDNKFTDLRTVPANTNLGVKTKFKHEYKDENLTICKTPQGELVWVNSADVKEIKHTTSETKADVDALVEAKALLFDGNEYYPYPVYLFGDIYAKIRSLSENKEAIVAAYGEQVFEEQLAKVREYLPKLKTFRDPVKSNRPNMLCLSEFANNVEDFGVTDLHEETGIKLGRTVRNRFEAFTEKITLFSAFNYWLDQAVKDTDLKNTTRADIKKYYFAKSVAWPKDTLGDDILSNTQKQELIGNARLAAEELFSEFLAVGLTFEDSIVLDQLWNERYNAFTSVIQFVDKVPIGFNGSTMFKDGLLEVKPAQRQGLAYLQLVGAGTLAYDVGFGKTLTGILNLAQEISQGAIKRPLIVVPKPTYKNWLKELFGFWISADGQRTDFNKFEGATFHYGAFSGITNVKLNDWYNLSGKHYEKLLAANKGDLNKLIPENTITVVSYRGFEQMGFSRDISNELFDSIARVIMQKDVMEGQERTEKSAKKEAKEKVSFYQKVQGWLGLGNKNAIVNVDVCGFDHITVDEAHNFKNVFPGCGKDPATGRKLFDISASQSTRAVKMFFITNYIQAKFGKKVVDLTATPFTNSPLEIYSMLSFVGLDTLNQYNLYNIKKFFEMFVLQTIEYAIDAKGEIVTKPVIKSFQNLKLLQTILFNHFHYKADPKEAGIVRPCLINLPNKDITTYLEMNEMQRANQIAVKEMARSVSRDNPGAGLRAMAMSLDNAFSPYLFSKEAPESAEEFVDNSPKIKYAVECIKSIKTWHEARGEECSGVILYSNRGLSYFEYIKDYLIHNVGFKNNISYDDEILSEVEIISGGGGEADEDHKELIKDAFNAGIVKVIIGTGTIREGINLQKRCPTSIDLYPEWNPTDVWQLKGRNWRQGNIFGYCRFVMPLVINSMDNFINQKLDEKGQRIASIWAPIGDSNSLENTSDLDPAEIKYQLVDDVNERFKMKYETIRNEMSRQLKILIENKEVIEGVANDVERLKSAEENLFTEFVDNKPKWAELLTYLKGLPLAKFKKVKEMAKTVGDVERVINTLTELITGFEKYEANRYDIPQLLIVTRLIKNRSFEIFTDYSREGLDIKENYSNAFNYHTFRIPQWDYDKFVDAYGDVRKAEKSVLNAYGKSWLDDIKPILKAVDKKISAVEREKEAVESDEYKNKLTNTIVTEMEAAKSVRGDLAEQVGRFASLNYLLSYLSDNTDKENCEIPTVECCPTNGINIVHRDKEISEPVVFVEEEQVKLSPEAIYFVPKHQLSIIKNNVEFNDARIRVNKAVSDLPGTYQTDGIKAPDKIAYLHYFYGDMNWYIFEKDMGDGSKDKSQRQAFGMASFGQEYEMGYIDISAFITDNKVELDLYFTPTEWKNVNKGAISATENINQGATNDTAEAIELLQELAESQTGKKRKVTLEAIELLKDLL